MTPREDGGTQRALELPVELDVSMESRTVSLLHSILEPLSLSPVAQRLFWQYAPHITKLFSRCS